MKNGQTFRAKRSNGEYVKQGAVYTFLSHEISKAKVFTKTSTRPVAFLIDGKEQMVDWFEAIGPDGKVKKFFTRLFEFEIVN
jgi:hypothetical protein